MAELLKGKPVADAMKEALTKKVEDLKQRGIEPNLGIIRVGQRPDDLFYEGGAKKTCAAIGMASEVFEYPEDVDQAGFEKAVVEIGAKKDCARHPDVFTPAKAPGRSKNQSVDSG